MPPTNSGSSPLFVRLTTVLEGLEKPTSESSDRIVLLPLHKKMQS